MRPIIRALGVVAATGALVAGSATGIAGARPGGDPGYRADIAWAPCEELATVECGTVPMPVDWAEPDGEKFDLALARRAADDPAKREGVLFINPGGPGGPGVDFTLVADSYFSPEVLKSFDIVGVDPRGVGRSSPVRCSLEKVNANPGPLPANQAEFDALARYNRELADDCRSHSGPIYDHVSTLDVVEDLDAVRRSLGEARVSYYGVSYGTLIGRQYAEKHGDRVRAMVIDSNMDHDQGAAEFLASEAVGAEDSFEEFVAWCERTEACALHDQDVPEVWNSLLERADRGELTAPGDPEQRITSADLRGMALSAFYSPSWAQLATTLTRLDSPDPALFGVAEPELGRNAMGSVFCQDWALPVRDHAEFQEITERSLALSPNMRGSTLGQGAVAACVGTEDANSNPRLPWRVAEGTPRVLMLNALHDPSTPYEWAVGAHRQAGGAAVLLTYEGWGHGAYGRSECVTGATDAYLVDLVVPAEGTRCAGVEPPAQEPEARTAQPGKPQLPGRGGWGALPLAG
ncbi:alpha/beta hydrolase [Actinosynnema mirum]|uniref:TAP domain protein n=1 Tax=Actinosynnema mirum (strain ATCC 29888 / DSM 43827 / JCM 3225 / NBRC 14064 / NCIMB 13271 / NRRL B-12336 / IMRU 3971 / 101) TaxID=446462 RepID=C6WEW8_ACTMD|nr:alpha/beta hydrolase [Actinosynnema mirum]ACU39743.1 TAP domain protein [Actinosynnema mirum DSM 43827]